MSTPKKSDPLEKARRLLRGEVFLGEVHPSGEPVFLPPGKRFQHTYCVGKSGYGKTTLIRNLVLQDLVAGHGLALLGPDEDLFERQILPLIPENRLDDVVYIDPADTARPVPLNPFFLEPGEDLDIKVDDTLTVFKRLFSDETGGGAPRMETILRNAIYTLTRIPGSTPLDIERILDRQDGTFRAWAVSQVPSEDVRRFWTTTYVAYPKDAHLSVLNRLSPFLQPEKVRNTLCAKGAFSFRRAMDSGKVVLVNLSESRLGGGNARIIGQLVVTKLQLAALSRADVPESLRRPFFVYIDEFQTFCGAALESYQTMFSRTRKYHVPLMIAHLQTGDLPEALVRSILGTVSTIVAFRVGHDDGVRLGRELVHLGRERDGTLQLRPMDSGLLVDLPVGHAWCRIGDRTVHVITPPPPDAGDARVAEQAISRSRETFGVAFEPSMPAPPAVQPSEMVSPKPRPLADIDPGQVF